MTNLLRATLRPRALRPVLLVTTGAALLCAGVGIGVGVTSRSQILLTPPPVVVLPAQVNVAPAPVLLPPTPVVAEAPAPPAVPSVPVPPPNPRALVPMLDASCVIANPSVPNPTCAWDDGFPAISADGAVIATKHFPDTGYSDYAGLSIRFIDTKTSRVVRDSKLMTADEQAVMFSAETAGSGDASSDDKQQQRRQRVAIAVAGRVDAVQRTFEAKHFRSLRALGSASIRDVSEPAASQRGPDPIYAEIVGTTARIVDSKASQVLWRHEFYVGGPEHVANEHSDCTGWSPWFIELWWDPETRHVLAKQSYRTGGCMCSEVSVETVARIP